MHPISRTHDINHHLLQIMPELLPFVVDLFEIRLPNKDLLYWFGELNAAAPDGRRNLLFHDPLQSLGHDVTNSVEGPVVVKLLVRRRGDARESRRRREALRRLASGRAQRIARLGRLQGSRK
jgi:hypothetical protein